MKITILDFLIKYLRILKRFRANSHSEPFCMHCYLMCKIIRNLATRGPNSWSANRDFKQR